MNNVSSEKLARVGNLMIDAAQSRMNPIEIRERLGLSRNFPIISLLPGSKAFKVKYSTPFLLKIADYIFSKRPDIQFIIPQSPYTPLYQLVGSVTEQKYISVLDGVSAKFGQDKHGNVLLTEKGTLINIIPSDFQYEAFQISDVAITLPGTNTAELASLGIPMITIFPTKKLDHIPIEGLLGRISDLPLLNKILKPFIIKKGLEKIKFISIPNQKASYNITPEFIGDIYPLDVANTALEIIDNYEKRRSISLELRKIMGSGGADMNIVDIVLDTLFLKYPDIEILKITNNLSDWTRKNPDND
jgi:lipid-A-disaccharide synthase